MNKDKYLEALMKLKNLRKQAMVFYRKNNLQKRNRIYSDNPNAEEWKRHEIIPHVTFLEWQSKIEKIAGKYFIAEDYDEFAHIFTNITLGENSDTKANRFEMKIDTLGKAIEFIEEKYGLDKNIKFTYDFKKSCLLKNGTVSIDFKSGKIHNSNQQKLTEYLFKQKRYNYEVDETALDFKGDNDRWLETACRKLNEKVGVELFIRNKKKFESTNTVWLNPEFL